MALKTFPCPYCTRLGEEPVTQGDCVDMGDDEVGSIMVQIAPDDLCGGCGGEGFIPVGSRRHFDVKVNSLYNLIAKCFGEEFIDNLSESETDKFWLPLQKSFMSIRDKWLNQKARKESENEITGCTKPTGETIHAE